ncbi:LysE family translocator [Priestia abyssalis]|uniref:LysE family translocator n=1 Tax=Priestia abyssalis TaxID=1221450 RepID=UPI0009954456|nr:LysE family translocator [Priestia abyssalis]
MNEFLTFFVLSLFVVMSPGIDTALITKTTIATGKKTGFQMALGISTGSLVHTFAAAFGLSAILLQSAAAFEIVKYAGAVYLLYLGVSSLWASNKKQTIEGENLPELNKKGSPFKQGLLSNVLNPKVAMFFLTFLPQFVTPGESTTQQLIIMGIVYTVLSITWFFIYVYFINYMREWLLSPNVQKWMDKATGLVLIGFGLKLALEKHR